MPAHRPSARIRMKGPIRTRRLTWVALPILSFVLTLGMARADFVLQPGPGANDGSDDGRVSQGKDAAVYMESISGGRIANGGAEALMDIYYSPCNIGVNGAVLPVYLQFSTNGLPLQGVDKAEVQVYCRVFYNGFGWPWPIRNPTAAIRRVTQPWNEMQVTANAHPAVDPAILDSRVVTTVGGGVSGTYNPIYMEYEGWLSFDITGAYLAWASGAQPNYGVEFRLETPFCQNGDVFGICSSDETNANLRPKLVLKGAAFGGLPPVFTGDSHWQGTVGAAFSGQVMADNNPTWFGAFGLPAGLSINSTNGLITGTPLSTGEFAVTLQMANDYGAISTNVPFSVLASGITSTNKAGGKVGDAFSYQITANDDPTWYDAVGLPAGLNINTNTGVIDGTPAAAGLYFVLITAGNGVVSHAAYVKLDIAPLAPVITGPTSVTGQVAVTFNYWITATNNPAWYDAGGLPDGLTVAPWGLISGIPAAAGTYAVQVFAGNRSGTNSASLPLTVLPPAPVITSPASVGSQVRRPFAYTITATNAPTGFGATNLPAWLTLDPVSGLLSGVPTNTGTYALPLSASNAYGVGYAVLSLSITNSSFTYTQTFETGMGEWTSSADSDYMGNSAWAVGGTNSGLAHGGTHFVYSGRVRGLSWATPHGTWLASPQITAANTNVTLSFSHVFGLNDGGWGWGQVLISVNGGAYQSVGYYSSLNGFTMGAALPPQVTNTAQYSSAQIDLGGYLKANDTFTLMFYAHSREGTFSPGWMIDDIAVSGVMILPTFTSVNLTGALRGAPFVHQVAANHATGYSATGLPAGLVLDSASGLITGVPNAAGAFNVTITATNEHAIATQTLRIVVNSQAGVYWREDFNSGLAASWTTVPADTNYYGFQPGTMKLRANNGDTWTYYNRDLNLFAVDTPTAGDFMLTLGVSKCVLSLVNYPALLLTAWDDTDNYVRYGYLASTGGRSGNVAIESKQTVTYNAGSALDFGANAFALRLVKQGNLYSCWWSTNGTDFVALGSATPSPYSSGFPRQVGFWFGIDPNQSDTALIDYFEVSAVTMTNAAVPPVFASGTLTGGLQGAPFVWDVCADYATGFSAAGLPSGLSIDPGIGRITGTPDAAGTYDCTVSASNAWGGATQSLRIVVTPSRTCLFHEDFNHRLGAAWTTLPADTSYYSFPVGLMLLRANNGDTWQSAYNRPINLFAVDTPTAGDFMLTLGVRRFVPSQRDNPAIFIAAWDDTDNLVRYDYAGSSGGPLAYLNAETHAGTTFNAGLSMSFGTNAFALRLVKSGNVYSAWWSTNGADFVALAGVLPATYANFVPRQVGFWMSLDPTQSDTMLIDYFDVSTLTMTNAGVPPVFVSAKLTGALQGAPFVWDVSADYATGFSAADLPPGLSIGPAGRITGTPIAAGVYDAVITATNGFGAATQTLRIVVRKRGGVLFRDDFNAGPSAGWGSMPTNYITALPGIERVRANNGDNMIATAPMPFALPTPTNQVFALTLGVSKWVPATWNYPELVLAAWRDFDHLARFVTYGSAGGPRAVLSMETSPGVQVYTDYPTNFASGPFLIRLNVASNTYTSAYSTNGVDFIPLPGAYSPATFTNTLVGFWAGFDPYQNEIALVDYFEVSTTPPPDPVPGWAAGYGLTGTNAEDDADADLDGLKNIFEYAFNLNPTSPAGAVFPAPGIEDDHLVLRFRVRSGGTGTVGTDYTAGNLTYQVQVADSPDAPWISDTGLVEQAGPATSNGDGTDTVGVRLRPAIADLTRKFMRLILLPGW